MKVSIVMPIYNVEKFIDESISSILNQDCQDFELIIIDDGSTDKTYEYVKPYLKDQRLKYFNFGRLGKIKAFNKGYQYVTSNFICFFHGDDIMTKHSITSRLKPLENNSKKLIACCGKLETKSAYKKYDSAIIPKGEKGSLSGQAVMYRKELTDIIFPIPETLPNEDFWMRLHIQYLSHELIHVPNIIAKYRIHEENSFLSIGALNNFREKNEKIHIRRSLVLNEFILKYRKKIKIEDINRIRNYLAAEEYRYSGNYLYLIFSKIGIKDKMRFLFESNKIMYQIKNKFSKLFLGRG